MPSLGNFLHLSLIAGMILCSCNPLSQNEKGSLRLVDNTKPIIRTLKPKLEATFESIQFHFIKKSCLDCHNSQSGRVSFESEQDVIDNKDDILFYTEFGCDLGSCMPPRNQNGEPRRPVPTSEVLEAFRTWSDNVL